MPIAVHPGEILAEEFTAPLGPSQNALAHLVHVPPRRINEIVHAKRSVTADTALRLAKAFGATPEFWANMQTHYGLVNASAAAGDFEGIQAKRVNLNLLAVVQRCHPDTLRQVKWANAAIKENSTQILVS